MSSINVTPEFVLRSARPLAGIGDQVRDAHGRLGAHSAAAQGTSGDDAFQAGMANWADALPQFADSADRMCAAIALAAAGYSVTDGAVAAQATPVVVTTTPR
jgi:uncharacterized protein YukE